MNSENVLHLGCEKLYETHVVLSLIEQHVAIYEQLVVQPPIFYVKRSTARPLRKVFLLQHKTHSVECRIIWFIYCDDEAKTQQNLFFINQKK